MKQIYILMFLGLFLLFLPLTNVKAETAQAKVLKGRILLQVESRGEAWYVDPQSGNRAYLGRPIEALKTFQKFGIGMSNDNINRISSIGSLDVDKAFAQKFAGRVLLQVEDYGQAWYVNPVDLKKYYLGDRNDAFVIMRELGLGITNAKLSQIPVDSRYGNPNLTAKTFRLAISNFQFVPKSVEITRGDTIVWTNEDVNVHTITTTNSDLRAFGSGQLVQGMTYSYTFVTSGIYDYKCSLHPTMTGRVVVR